MFSDEQIESMKSDLPTVGKLNVDTLVTIEEVERLVNLRPFCKFGRWMPTVDDEHYQWQNNYWSTEHNAAPLDVIEEALEKGSCYFTDSSKINPTVNDIVDNLETIFDVDVDCHVFFSKYNTNSFDFHKDEGANVIMPSVGALHVFLENMFDRVLQPGEFVFIPKGQSHKIVPLTTPRVSCSFPIAPHDAFNNNIRENRKWFKLC